MEIKEMTNEELEKRLSEIKTEMVAEGANIEELSKEVDAIEQRRKELVAEKRSALEAKVNANEGVTVVTTVESEKESRSMENIEVRNTKAYINAYANYIKTNDDSECRALLTENGSGSVPIPELVNNVVKTAWDEEGIMRRVKKAYIKGNLKVGFEVSATDAVNAVEGQAVTEETLILGTVNLVPNNVKKWISVSDEVLDMDGEGFLQYIYNELAHKIAKKMADNLIAKIEACGTASTSTQVGVPVVEVASIGVGTIAKAIGRLSDEANKPIIMMNKLTYSAFKEIQNNANYAVDVFDGLEVEFNNTITAYDVATTGDTIAIVGDLAQGALANFPNGEEIKFNFDDKTLATSDLIRVIGREFVAVEPIAPNAFVKIQIGSAG